MARYIDADLIENIELIPYKRRSGNINVIIANMAIAGAKQVVDKIPTADVAPVVHAHWIEKEDCSVITDIPWSMCSACGEYSPKLLYCAFCGAKMDEEAG